MDYNVYADNTMALGALSAVFWIVMGVMLLLLLFCLIVYVRLFQKAGRAGWKAIIPIYNTWVLFEICYLPGWLALLSLVPIANFVAFIATIIALYRLPQCYEKSSMWGILNIFFSLIIMAICAFDKSEYCGYEK